MRIARVTPLIASAILMAWASLSITHGPATRKNCARSPIVKSCPGNLNDQFFVIFTGNGSQDVRWKDDTGMRGAFVIRLLGTLRTSDGKDDVGHHAAVAHRPQRFLQEFRANL